MDIQPLHLYVFLSVFYLLSAFFSFIINWLLLKFSFKLGGRGAEGQVRWSLSKPAVGGISFFIVFLISISVLGTLPRQSGLMLDKNLIGIIAASSLGFLLGLADDAYNTNPLAKFIVQLTCAFILILSDVYINLTGNAAFDFGLTTIWVIGLMNSINMLDNMDAITTTTSMAVILGAIVIIGISGFSENTLYMVMLVGVLGALTGFLYYNWNPSRIYMGDTGSQFLGVFLAAISILFFWNFRSDTSEWLQLRQFVVPMLLFIVPLLDTTTVTIRRLLRKQSPFVGGRDHITHHLAYLGLSDRSVALVLLSLSLISIPLSLVFIMEWIEWDYLATFAAFAYFFIVFAVMQILYNVGKRKHEKKIQTALP